MSTTMTTPARRRESRWGCRFARSAVALAVAVGLTTGPSAGTASASTASAGMMSASTTSAGTDLSAPFSREVVRPGAVDRDPYAIAHVHELQYRLRWAGVFTATPNGMFGPLTLAAVKTFQKRNGLRATGVVGAATWKRLIRQTVRGRGAVPTACKSAGQHACYDRWRSQVNLYSNGRLLNSWLVRGGSSTLPTRLGTFRVYYRDIDHVSGLYGSPMPYSQFFSGGQALHGSRLLMNPFVGHSHGCVNFYVEDARQLWKLTVGKRLFVHVYGAWS